MNKKSVPASFLAVLLIGGLVLAGIMHFSTVKAATSVSGIITSDTTWTKANSPYNLNGPLQVNNGITLTIEAGATVNLNGYYIQVDGTLVAKGSSINLIHFNTGEIVFTETSRGWNEQTSSGCIIENAVLNTTLSIVASPKIDSNYINSEIFALDGSPIISNNRIAGGITAYGSSAVSYNDIMTTMVCGGVSIFSHNNFVEGAIVTGGTPSILNNNIQCGSHSINNNPSADIHFAAILIDKGAAVISQNNITYPFDRPAGSAGIYLGKGTGAYIHDNIISGFGSSGSGGIYGVEVGDVTIERNLISHNLFGIHFGTYETGSGNIMVRNNTVSINILGFDGYYPPTFIYNNIYDNDPYNIKIGSSLTINATHNWWGTTDEQTISQKLWGSIIYNPFLNELNPETTPGISSNSLPNPASASSLSPTVPIQAEVYVLAVAFAVVIAVLLIVILVWRKKSKSQNAPVSIGSEKIE